MSKSFITSCKTNACPYIFSYIKVKIQLSSLKLYVIFFFLLPANLWKCVPATQCRKNLIIKIISQYIYIEYLLVRPYTKPMCCFVKSSQKPHDTGTLSLSFYRWRNRRDSWLGLFSRFNFHKYLSCLWVSYLSNVIQDRDLKLPVHECTIRVRNCVI